MAENFTTKERQGIYQHLLTLQCPDLLAALIANRVDRKFTDSNCLYNSDLSSWITESFDWVETPEGYDFWYDMHYSGIYMGFDTLGEGYPPISVEIVPFDAVKIIDDLTISQPTVAESTDNTTFEMYAQHTQEPLPFWTRVKLFFGK